MDHNSFECILVVYMAKNYLHWEENLYLADVRKSIHL